MAFPSNTKRQYYLASLAACIVVSTYGLTAGRPVLQIGALQFPYAETLPFPYPLTTTLFQLIWTYACLLFGSLVARSTNIFFDDLEGRSSGRFMSSRGSRGVIPASNWIVTLKIFPLAAMVAAEATLGNYVLYNLPFEVYLLSRALVLPLLLPLERFVYGKSTAGRLTYPSIALSISVLVTAFKSVSPHSGQTVLIIVSSSLLSALWPLQVQACRQSAELLSKGEYTVVESAETASKKGRMEIYATWSMLYYTSQLSSIVLIPIGLYSGEPGHILRNCYFLNELRFWLYMAAGAMFRLTFFISMVFFIEETSALTAVFFCILTNVTQTMFFIFGNLRALQSFGLTGSFLSSLWFLIASVDFDPTRKSIWQNNLSAFRRWFYFVVIMIAIVIGFGTVLQICHSEETVDSSPPRDRDDIGDFPASLYTAMLQGTDAYLDHRPPANSVINLQLLMEECEGTESLVTEDVFRCLEFLSTKQNTYLVTPSELSRAGSSGDDIEVVDGSAGTDEVESPSKICNGPIIPYHIWRNSPPTWRTELFIKAYLYTQNLPCSRLWIWVDGTDQDYAIGKWLLDHRIARFQHLFESGLIIIKEWRLPRRVPLPPRNSLDELDKARYYRNPGRSNAKGERLVADFIVQDSSGQEWLQFHGDESQIILYDKALSDVARFTIIHMHGGIYLDAGMILLRDIRPVLLSNIAFIEKPDPREPFGNSVIAIPANSSISSYILRGGTRMGLFFHAAVLQRMFIQEGRDENNYDGGLVRLEGALFDPIWAESHGLRKGRCTVPCLSSYANVFEAAPVRKEWESFDGEMFGGATYNRTLENFYRGAFAYRIHGQKKTQYERGSWMDVICSAHDRFFAGERLNPYGEKWNGPSITNYRHSS